MELPPVTTLTHHVESKTIHIDNLPAPDDLEDFKEWPNQTLPASLLQLLPQSVAITSVEKSSSDDDTIDLIIGIDSNSMLTIGILLSTLSDNVKDLCKETPTPRTIAVHEASNKVVSIPGLFASPTQDELAEHIKHGPEEDYYSLEGNKD